MIDCETNLTNSADEEIAEAKKQKKAGVIYLSRIPKKMNVRIIRDYFSQFGKVDRIYLEPRGIYACF